MRDLLRRSCRSLQLIRRNGLKRLLVGSTPFQLVKSLGKGRGGTKMFVQLKPVPDMASQLAPKTRMGDFFCANAASTKHPRLVL